MRTLIVEDEPKNIKILKKFLGDYFPEVQIVGEATNVQKAKELYYALQPELLILDIQLTTGNAFDLLDEIMPVACEIIFITAYDGYALKAFKYSAIDYLLKPINIEELRVAITKAEQKIGQKNINIQLKQLIENFNKPNISKIALSTDSEIRFISVNEIMYCSAMGIRTSVHTSSNQVFLTFRPIGEYEELLPGELFFRIHNSFLINMNFVVKYIKGRGGILEMQDGTKIEVASRRKDEFLARFNN
jgi:two-component system LytT family response regulator